MTWLLLILSVGLQIGVNMVILGIALWIMIKVQKLNYNILGLIGSAALASVLDAVFNVILGHYLGFGPLASYLYRPVVVGVLFVCISKVTQADTVDVAFTIGVGYAVNFVLNLWLLAAVMPDFTSSHGAADDGMAPETEAEYEVVDTNSPTIGATKTNYAPRKAPLPAKPTSPPVAKVTAKTVKGFSLKGIIAGPKPSAMVSTGSKTYTVFQGDSLLMETAEGNVNVRCEKLDQDKVVLALGGETITLSLSGVKP